MFRVPEALEAADQPGKIYRIGTAEFSTEPATALRATFRRALNELGWIDGQNIRFETRCCAAGNVGRLEEFVAQLVAENVDLLFVASPHAARAAQAATKRIPIVFAAVSYPVELGLVSSLSRPGGNITGVSQFAGVPGQFVGKQIQLIKEMIQKPSPVVGVLINPNNPVNQRLDLPRLAAELEDQTGAAVRLFHVRSAGDFAGAFGEAKRDRVDAVVITGDPIAFAQRRAIADLAAQHRVPAIYYFRDHAEAGGLMTYGADLHDIMRRGAVYVDKVLRGANPGDIPVEQASKFALVINTKTAQALGLVIPRSLLVRADEIIQ